MVPSLLPAIFTVPKALGPVAGGGDFLLAVEHELDRGAGAAGQLGGGDALDVRAELAAEAAAHVVGDALHLGRRHAEPAGERRRRPRPCLRGGPDGQPAVRVPLGDQAVRFEALVGDDRHAVGALDGRVGRP